MEFCRGSGSPGERKGCSFITPRENPQVPSICCTPSPCELFLETGGHKMQMRPHQQNWAWWWQRERLRDSRCPGRETERMRLVTVPREASPPSGHKWKLLSSQPRKCQRESVRLSTHTLHPTPPPRWRHWTPFSESGLWNRHRPPGVWVYTTWVQGGTYRVTRLPLAVPETSAQACSVKAASKQAPLGPWWSEVKWKWKSLSHVRLFVTPWTI